MQSSASIAWTSFFSPDMAFWGQTPTHRPQPVHISGSMEYLISSGQTPAGHLPSDMWAMYSSLKYLIVLRTGFAAV